MTPPSVLRIAISESRNTGTAITSGTSPVLTIGVVSEAQFNTAAVTTAISTPTLSVKAMTTTASYAHSSSYAFSSSYAQTATTLLGSVETASLAVLALTASYAEEVPWWGVTDKPSGLISSSTQVVGEQVQGTVNNAVTASYALSNAGVITSAVSASHAIIADSVNGTTANVEQLNINAGTTQFRITGSISSGIFGVTEYVRPYVNMNVYSGVVIEYVAQRTMGLRLGMLLGLWSGSSVTFTDISTNDIGDTEDLSLSIIQIGDQAIFRVNSDGIGAGAWTVQSVFKLFPKLT